MGIPSEPILRAATRWLKLLPTSGAAKSRTILTSHKDFSDITPTQYETAYAWLERTGLLQCQWNDDHMAFSVLEHSLIRDSPHWFQDADLLVRGPDELPADAILAARVLGLSLSQAYTCIAATWGKVDIANRKRIGDAGELALAALIKEATGADIDHVATYNDAIGFDLFVRSWSGQSHIEVKSTTRSNRITVYLSRNEFETMKRDREWHLVTIKLDAQMQALAVGTVPRDWLVHNVPDNTSTYGRWESFRLEIPPEGLELGIPFLTDDLLPHSNNLMITGQIPWFD